MNKKIIVGGLTLGTLYAFVFASTTSAFWPFDALFKKQGDVKAKVTEKMYIPEGERSGKKAYMTYQTLVGMNEACRKLLSQDFNENRKVSVTPSANDSESLLAKKQKNDAKGSKMIQEESGVSKSNENELGSIYNNLKARCGNIANLVIRMQKIYKGEMPEMKTERSVTPSTLETGAEVTPTAGKKPLFNIRFREENKEKVEERKTEKSE